ncbi:hypothetical protein [Jiella endophytica]|uniref:hypothetical protein n=1 Tax=Jiella endophytica TaxID=2558362 RepID=UPI001431B0AC|nr:hypothetical protein [Jiella endophytica]
MKSTQPSKGWRIDHALETLDAYSWPSLLNGREALVCSPDHGEALKLADALESAGARATIATDQAIALDRASRRPFSFAILVLDGGGLLSSALHSTLRAGRAQVVILAKPEHHDPLREQAPPAFVAARSITEREPVLTIVETTDEQSFSEDDDDHSQITWAGMWDDIAGRDACFERRHRTLLPWEPIRHLGQAERQRLADLFRGIWLLQDRHLGPTRFDPVAAVAGGEDEGDAHLIKAVGDRIDHLTADIDVEHRAVDADTRIEQFARRPEAHCRADHMASEFQKHVLELQRDEAFILHDQNTEALHAAFGHNLVRGQRSQPRIFPPQNGK